jgi:serine protease Do
MKNIFICLIAAGLGMAPLQSREPAATLEDLVKLEQKVAGVSQRVLGTTVALLSGQTESSGSGVVVAADGLILTAAHVIQGSEEVVVVFPDGKQVPGKVLGANYSKDIAMVKISEAGPWPFVEMGESKPLKAGDWVVALGHSAGFDPGRTPPVRFGRVVSEGPGNFFTTDCTLIGGDSGGPLFDLEGKLVGIHSSIGYSLKNNNHAGIDGFRVDWERMLEGEAWGRLSMNPFAPSEMPVLGIGMGVERGHRGVPVESVAANSPAAAAGIRVGDVIQSINAERIRNGQELLQVLAKRQAGDEVKVAVMRGQRQLEFEVVLASRADVYREDR